MTCELCQPIVRIKSAGGPPADSSLSVNPSSCCVANSFYRVDLCSRSLEHRRHATIACDIQFRPGGGTYSTTWAAPSDNKFCGMFRGFLLSLRKMALISVIWVGLACKRRVCWTILGNKAVRRRKQKRRCTKNLSAKRKLSNKFR